MKKILKTKSTFAIVALILAFSLVVSGVLMLFTADTTVAANAVYATTGVSGQLWETEGNQWLWTTDDAGIGLDYGVQWSGEIIPKRPKVVRDDADPAKAADAYVAVKVEPVLDLSAMPVRYVKFQGVSRRTYTTGDRWGFSIYRMEAYSPDEPGINVALDKSAFASSYDANLNGAGWSLYPGRVTELNPADRIAGTPANVRWSTDWFANTYGDLENEWLYIDFGKPYRLSSIEIQFQGSQDPSYLIQVSNDAVTWITVAECYRGTGANAWSVINFDGGTAAPGAYRGALIPDDAEIKLSDFTLSDPAGLSDLAGLLSGSPSGAFSRADIEAFLAGMIDPAAAWWYDYEESAGPTSTDANWVYCLDEPAAGVPAYGWFFYVDAAPAARYLKKLPPKPAETSEIFTDIKIPLFYDPDQLELFAAMGRTGVTLDFRLTAYLVMADSNSYGINFADYIAPFEELLDP